MIIIPTHRKSKHEAEIIEILTKYGISHFSDKQIILGSTKHISISIYKPIGLCLKNAIAIFTENSVKFNNQKFPIGVIGICEDNNKNALLCFKKSGNAVITCGTNNKNTVTMSSITDKSVIITLQRSVIDTKGNRIEPMEFKILITKNYSKYSIMACAVALILNGFTPYEF